MDPLKANQDPGESTPQETPQETTGEEQAPAPEPTEKESGAEEESFSDVSDLPKELQARYKQMQADYTKKTQALSERGKDLDNLKYRSQLLDQLVNHPDFQEFLRLRNEGSLPSPEGGEEAGGEEGEGELDPKLAAALQKYLKPVQEHLQQLEVQRERETFVAAYPDWESHKDGMKEAWDKNQSLTMEQAYLIAKAKSGLTSQKKEEARKKAAVEKPGSPAPTTKATKVESYKDAVEAACEELGIDPTQFRG